MTEPGAGRQLAFAATTHRLPRARLRPLAGGEAGDLAAALAAIDPFRRLGLSSAGLAAYLLRRDHALRRFAIDTDGRAVGLLAMRWPWLRGPLIETLAILPAAQRQGLGSQAVDWAATQAGRLAANLWVTVSDFNYAGRAFYARQGFAEVARLPDLIAETSDEILLRRRL